jgi:Bax protein
VASLTSRTAKVPAIPGAASLPLVVTRDFAKQIPQSHVGLPVKRQKESFIGITLPLILAANEEISQRRKAIERAVSRGDQATVERWARLYRIETEDRPLEEIERKLLLRADFVPVSLALAQAAIESGWGTSRFALQGNALFGQWAWQKDAGLKPARASNSQAVVRSFPNLFGSVRAYMHNLNTHPRYAAFRARRHLLRGRTKADLGYQLSNFLDGYAEIGEVYVAKLKTLIRSNDLGRYEVAKLR